MIGNYHIRCKLIHLPQATSRPKGIEPKRKYMYKKLIPTEIATSFLLNIIYNMRQATCLASNSWHPQCVHSIVLARNGRIKRGFRNSRKFLEENSDTPSSDTTVNHRCHSCVWNKTTLCEVVRDNSCLSTNTEVSRFFAKLPFLSAIFNYIHHNRWRILTCVRVHKWC